MTGRNRGIQGGGLSRNEGDWVYYLVEEWMREREEGRGGRVVSK